MGHPNSGSVDIPAAAIAEGTALRAAISEQFLDLNEEKAFNEVSFEVDGDIARFTGSIGFNEQVDPDLADLLIEYGVAFDWEMWSESVDDDCGKLYGYWRPGMAAPVTVPASDVDVISCFEVRRILRENPGNGAKALLREIERREALLPPLPV